MKTFQYQAIDKNNALAQGTLRAESEKQARQQLRELGLLPSKVTEKKNTSSLFNIKRTAKISKFDTSIIMRELAELLSSGIPLVEALGILSEQMEKKHLKNIILDLKEKIQEGYSLSQALNMHKTLFSPLYSATIAAGEASGHLSAVIQHLANYSEQQYENSQKFQKALIYPALMTIISISVVVFLLVFVFPKFISIFEDMDKSLPLITEILLNITNFFSRYYILFVSSIISIIIIIALLLQNTHINFKKDQWLLATPLLSTYLGKFYTMQFTHILALLVRSDVAIVEAIQISANLIKNKAMQKALYQASLSIREGASIAQALYTTGLFSSLTINFIKNGEASGHLGDMLERIANIHDRALSRNIDIFLTLFEPLLILIMGALVLFIVLAMLLPMLDITQMIA